VRIEDYKARWQEHREGKKHERQRTFPRRKDAERFLANEVNPSRDWDAAKQKFAAAFARWLETRHLKPRTREGYEQAASYALRFFDNTAIAEISAVAAQDFLSHLQTTPSLRRIQSIRWAWYPFRATLDLAVRQGALASNPARLVELPTPSRAGEKKYTPHFLSPIQVSAIVENLPAPYDLMVEFMAYTGLRAGEVAGLNVEDAKLWETKQGWRGYVAIHRTRRKVRGGWEESTPKSENSNRQVRLPCWLAEKLAAYIANHPAATPGNPLWPGKVNGGIEHVALLWTKPVELGTFYRSTFRPACQSASLPNVRLHDLRHSFAAIMLQAGASIYEVSEQMGHAGYRITLDVYAHLIPREDDSHPLGPRSERVQRGAAEPVVARVARCPVTAAAAITPVPTVGEPTLVGVRTT
jgi:integrase